MTRVATAADQQPDLETAVARMAKVGVCHSPSFSPDGSRLALISDLSGVPQVWIVPTAGGWPELITPLDDPVRSVSWSPDGAWLAFVAARGGGMSGQVYLIRPDGTDMRRLTDGGRENNWLGPWSHDGRQLALSSNRRQPDTADVYMVEIPAGHLRLAATGQGTAFVSDISRDGHYAVVRRLVQRSDSNLALADLDQGGEVCLTPHEGPGFFGGGTFAPDGRTIYLISNADRDLTAFAQLHLDSDGRPGPIEVLGARDDAELEDFALTDDGAIAALVWNQAGRNSLQFFDAASQTLTDGPELAGEIILTTTLSTLSRDGRLLALTLAGAIQPADVWLFDRTTGELRKLTASPHAGVDLSRLVRSELIQFSAPFMGLSFGQPGVL